MNIEHIALWATDLEKLKTFYETYFGASANTKYVNPQKQFSSYFLRFDSGTRLEIMHNPTILDRKNDWQLQFTGYAHLAFSVGSKDKVDALTQQLAAAGYDVLDGPRTTGDGYYESVVLDPENNRVEITV